MKKSILVTALSALLIGVLSGCGGEEAKKVEEPKTAKYYKEHIDEAINTFLDCRKNDHYRSEGAKSIKAKNCLTATTTLKLENIYDAFRGTLNINGKAMPIDEIVK